MDVPFTQYIRPNGRKRECVVSCPDTLRTNVQAIIDRGWRFEAEVLTTDEVSLTVFDPETETNMAIQVGPNGSNVKRMVRELIKAGFKATQQQEHD